VVVPANAGTQVVVPANAGTHDFQKGKLDPAPD
jgi:hypothetical protein